MPPEKSPFAFPSQAARRGEEGAVIWWVLVDASGKPVKCEVDRTYGADFSKLVCDAIMHATFTPATDPTGAPAFGMFRTISNFYIPDKPVVEGAPPSDYPMTLSAELTLEVKPVAGLLEKPTSLMLTVLVDTKGMVADCSSADSASDKRLVAAACGAAKGKEADKPQTDKRGRPVPFVRTMLVAFIPK